MGLVKTSKLDNGNVGFEIIYGGAEAPFGGIDASASPRYIDPRCFVDASNFLIVSEELCYCSFEVDSFPSNGISYPRTETTTEPAVLLGAGKLPCEGIVKRWALFVAPNPDADGNWAYRLLVWSTDTVDTEIYNFSLPGQTVTSPPLQAKATITVDYAFGLSEIQSIDAYAINPGPAVPSTYDSKFYEMSPFSTTINGAPAGTSTYAAAFTLAVYTLYGVTPVSGPVTVPTPVTIAAELVAQINAATNLPFTAALTVGNPQQVTLTAATLAGYGSVDGAAGNALSLGPWTPLEEFGYFPATAGLSFVIEPPPSLGGFNYPPFTKNSFRLTLSQFSGGADGGQVLYNAQAIQQLTSETVGENLFLAGYPAGYMLWFNNQTKQFNILTEYQGVRVLHKFAGHLIGVGLINSIYQTETDAHLWLTWSAPQAYAIWNSVDANGNITGAGGEQLVDISDMLTGLVVSNSVAFILHAEGLSYATALQNAQAPFDVNHVALCADGQGCPSSALYCQYDQLGFYVGNTNVMMLAQSPQAVGQKIVNQLYPQLLKYTLALGTPFSDIFYKIVNVEPITLTINNKTVTLFAVNIGGIIFVFDPARDTWMKMDMSDLLPAPVFGSSYNWEALQLISWPVNSTTGFSGSYQYKNAYIFAQQKINAISPSPDLFEAPVLWRFSRKISSVLSASVVFPQEELLFGRDITIDAIYALISGIPGVVVDFSISGYQSTPDQEFLPDQYTSTLTLGAEATPDQAQEYQIFNAIGGAITLKTPQLSINVAPQTPPIYTPPVPFPQNSNPDFKITKIVMFGSFDPEQRPV